MPWRILNRRVLSSGDDQAVARCGVTVAAVGGWTGAAMAGAAVGAAGLAASAGFGASAGLAGAGGCPHATLSARPLVLTAHNWRNRRRESGPENRSRRRPRSREVI